ncbi:MAG: ABC transporter ATP-binding protein [Magnetococcales bacterium]|nr:ABC transporter ATP-binding protein [Magnetococcales bacterium]
METVEPLLRFDNVTVAYGAMRVLHGISLSIYRGEIVALVGANGAGKSTLLMTVFGQPHARAGDIYFDGQEITHFATHRIARCGIALVPEGRRVFAAMTVAENLNLGMTALISEKHWSDEVGLEQVYTLFPRLWERRQQRAGTLSGGEQQMLAIGRALMSRPKMLLLDEPSLGLAPLVVKQIFVNLQRIVQQGTTIFLVEQNANQALRLAQRGYVLVNGRITLAGSGAELLVNPQVRAAYLGEA